MDFLRVFREVCAALDAAGVHYALIGGFALILRGVVRATVDLDFLLLAADLERADRILKAAGYRRLWHSENVSHYLADDPERGRIDLLHAFRSASLGMLDRAERLSIGGAMAVPVVQTADLIGLKVQAAVNDPRRASLDWVDIRLLVEAASRQGQPLDWALLGDYLDLFDLGPELPRLRGWYGAAE